MNEKINENDNDIMNSEINEILDDEIKNNIIEMHILHYKHQVGGRIIGGLEEYIDIMIRKITSNDKQLGKNIGFMNCFDGANHMVTKDASVPIISFNAQMFSNDIIYNSSATNSRNIFTCQQAISKETWTNMKYLVEEHHNERKKVIELIRRKYGVSFQIYDIHDRKMLYMLSQYILYNRKSHPFLLCKCKEGYCYNKHKTCNKMTDEEIQRLYDNSNKKINTIKRENSNYNEEKHINWADNKILGLYILV